MCYSHPAASFTLLWWLTVCGSNMLTNVAMHQQRQWWRPLLASKHGCKECTVCFCFTRKKMPSTCLPQGYTHYLLVSNTDTKVFLLNQSGWGASYCTNQSAGGGAEKQTESAYVRSVWQSDHRWPGVDRWGCRSTTTRKIMCLSWLFYFVCTGQLKKPQKLGP